MENHPPSLSGSIFIVTTPSEIPFFKMFKDTVTQQECIWISAVMCAVDVGLLPKAVSKKTRLDELRKAPFRILDSFPLKQLAIVSFQNETCLNSEVGICPP